ncbi:MAG: hypothetical protein ABSE05_17045 [Syntrophales bacterium]|jgi:TM2 domain-containing membrane protein YozV
MRKFLIGLAFFIILACVAILLIKPGDSDRLSKDFFEIWQPISGVVLFIVGLALGISTLGRAVTKRAERKMAERKAAEEERQAAEGIRLKALPMLINCPVCNKEISREAVACPSCGHPINPIVTAQNPGVKTAVRTWNPGIAALLSLIIPGAGQMYKGQVGAGFLWFIFVVGGYFLFIIPGVILYIVCIFSAAAKS